MKHFRCAGLVLLLVCLALVVPVSAKAVFQCSLRTQGYLGGCDNIYARWFDQQHATSYVVRFGDGYSVTLPGSAQDYSRTGVGCGWGGQITIIGTYGTGGTCTASYSGNLPHNRPCDQCAASGIAPLDGIQNAANGRAYAAPGSIVAAYGSGIATTTQGAGFLPLPTELAGVKVFAGPNAEQCQLFYVSPGQVNFLLPNLGVGLNQITIVNASGSQFRGDLFLTHPAPGVFTRDGLRVAADFYPWGVSLYATGIVPEWVADPRDVRIRTGGIEYPASWVGYAPGFAGLVQINVPLPPGVVGSGASLFVGSAESQGFLLVR